DISLLEYEAFYDDHVKEISSGSPTTHFDSHLYASFIFDLSIKPFPPIDGSDFYEFTDELIPFISPSEPDVSHRCGTVKKFNTHRSHLNECPMMINENNTPILDVLLFHFYPP
nr:hypothetical protein [Tanacetum cinerariifolium]